jgi:hypothetical protein
MQSGEKKKVFQEPALERLFGEIELLFSFVVQCIPANFFKSSGYIKDRA